MNWKLATAIITIIIMIIILEKPINNEIKRVEPYNLQQIITQNDGLQNTVQTKENKQACNPPQKNKDKGLLSPELIGISGYLNTNQNITIGELVGKKIILVDFWTYSCINCQRTLPYLTSWHSQYSDKGFEIIGVHTPEFNFEKKYDNVKRAVEKFNIKYPVVQDNERKTWNAFQNRYWPAKYLIDISGNIAWTHFGEGNYEETENKIQELLAERSEQLCLNSQMPKEKIRVQAEKVDFYKIATPEIYLGYEFTRGNFGNPDGLPNKQTIDYVIPQELSKNNVYLSGTWFVDADNVLLNSENGEVLLEYNAKNVNIVASAQNGSEITIIVDGKKVKTLSVINDDLYRIVEGEDYGSHTVNLQIKGKGFRLYTFTFG